MKYSEHPVLNLPSIDPRRIRETAEGEQIYDVIRGKWVALTPEEWVRQHFVDWLVAAKGYSPYRIANEVGIKLNTMSRRCDTVVYDGTGRPAVIVEYKAPNVAVTQKVFDQIVRYNMIVNARLLIVSNGMCHYCCAIDYDRHTYRFLKEIPDAAREGQSR